MPSAMKFALAAWGSDAEDIVPVAKHAEALGFSGIWVGDHLAAPADLATAHPYQADRDPPIISPTTHLYDLWTVVGALIGATSRLTVAPGVAILPLRHPLFTARASISAYELAGGRFKLGVGTGWMPEEYAAVGLPFDDRGARCDEILDILEQLWGGGAVAHDSPQYRFGAIQMRDRPADIPLVFGGTSPPALRRAARRGDGWYGPTAPLEDSIEIRDRLEGMRAEAGRAEQPFEYHLKVHGDSTAEQVERYRSAGVEHLVLPWLSVHPHGRDNTLEAKLHSLEEVAAELGLRRELQVTAAGTEMP